MKKSRFTDRTKWKIIIVLMVGMVVVALFLQAGILMYVNSKNLDKTSQMLLDQSISIIEKNQKNEIDLIRSMKEDYVIRARAVSYILESRLEAENDTEELQKIASLMSIDEIYLFDPYDWKQSADEQVIFSIVGEPFRWNRRVHRERLNEQSMNMYALGKIEEREAMLLFNTKTRKTPERSIEYFI
jgi:hypothetical protein